MAGSRSEAEMYEVWLGHLIVKECKDMRINWVISKEHRSQLEGIPIGQIWDNLSIKK